MQEGEWSKGGSGRSRRDRGTLAWRVRLAHQRLCGQSERSYEKRVVLGAVVQLGERLHGMQEVRGSIPLRSTNGSFVYG